MFFLLPHVQTNNHNRNETQTGLLKKKKKTTDFDFTSHWLRKSITKQVKKKQSN